MYRSEGTLLVWVQSENRMGQKVFLPSEHNDSQTLASRWAVMALSPTAYESAAYIPVEVREVGK